MNIPKIATRIREPKLFKDLLRHKPYHLVFMLILLLVAIPAAILTCSIILPVKIALKTKAFLSKWLFVTLF